MSEVAARLANWIHAVDLDPGATRVKTIRAAAADLAQSSDEPAILDLVLLAHGTARGDASSSVATALREHDESTPVRDGDVLAALTAATATALALEGNPDRAVSFGLAVRSANFVGLQPVISELDALARAGLARASEAQRLRTKLAVVRADVEKALSGWPEVQEGQPVYGPSLDAAHDAVQKAAKSAAAVAPRLLPPITRRFEALEEEVDVLWWAFGEFSELAEKPFKSLSEHAAACVAGIELARRTSQRAPLPSSRAILSRILHLRADKGTDIGRALPAAVKAIGEEWGPDRPNPHPLLPVLASLDEYVNLGQKPVWKESVSARWDIDPAASVTNLDLAEQVTREILLVRYAEA